MISAIFKFFASYGFACVILFLLLVLTLLGTLDQVDNGLFVAQQKYFESFFVLHEFTPWFILPLPGAYLLMILLFINLLCGAIIRAPKDWKRPGNLIAHGGILFLILSGFVTYEFSTSGHMTLYEGERADYYQSYHDWVLTITELKEEGARTYSIPGEEFEHLEPDASRVFHHAGLPFDLLLEGFMPNAEPRRVPPMMAMGIDGVTLEPLERSETAEQNIAGCVVTLMEKPAGESADNAVEHAFDGGTTESGLLWGIGLPWVTEFAGGQYALSLHHTRYPVPFEITLDKFIRDLHPGTSMAANFESRVTMTEDGTRRPIEIKMNEPLRHEGFTFFQASWGPDGAPPGTPLFSTFAVVNNPSDQWPKYACYIIGLGLVIHFLQRLFIYIRSENRRRSA